MIATMITVLLASAQSMINYPECDFDEVPEACRLERLADDMDDMADKVDDEKDIPNDPLAWIFLATGPHGQRYETQLKNIGSIGNSGFIWYRAISYKNSRVGALESKIRVRIDCLNDTIEATNSIEYNVDGSVNQTFDYPVNLRERSPIAPDTFGEVLHGAVCR